MNYLNSGVKRRPRLSYTGAGVCWGRQGKQIRNHVKKSVERFSLMCDNMFYFDGGVANICVNMSKYASDLRIYIALI